MAVLTARNVFLICLVMIFAGRIGQAEDWKQFRGSDFGRTSETKVAENWNDESVAWKTPLLGRGASSPVVFKNHVYVTAFTGYAIDVHEPGDQAKLVRHLICADLNDGQIIWQKAIPDDTEKDKFSTWGTAKAGYASSTATIDDSGVYVLFGATGVVAFSHNGVERWRTFCGNDTHDYPAGTSPVIYEDLVIVNACYECGDLIALRKMDGGEVWRVQGLDEAWNTPVIYESADGSTELAIADKTGIIAVNPDTGEKKWSCSGINEYACPSVTAQDGIVFALSGKSGKGIAVRSGGSGDVTKSHRIWLIGKGTNVSSPVYSDRHLYWAKDKRGVVYCADAETGEIKYEKRLKPSAGEIYATPLLANGRLYYISREKGIFVVAAKPEFKLLSHTKFESDNSLFAASPAVLPGGAVLLRSDQYLYRLKPVK